MSSARSKSSLPDGPSNGIGSELRQLSSNATATATELREFLANNEGKSPQEMLGLIAQSGLFLSTLAATGLIGGVLVVFTLVPYLIWGSDKPDQEPAAAAADNAQPADGDVAEKDESPKSPAVNDPTTTTTDGGDEVTGALGISEQKSGTPDVDPKLDSLLEID